MAASAESPAYLTTYSSSRHVLYCVTLERDLKQPSLEMLRRISDCLEVPIFILFSEYETSDSQANNQGTSEYSIVGMVSLICFTLSHLRYILRASSS